jgi:hypothetical protein
MADIVYNLNEMDPNTFEHLSNALALKVLGAGHTTFGPGSDGGRDGLFEGEAPYPSSVDRWSGTWYIQSKFHGPNLSSDHNKWLIRQVQGEIDAFTKPGNDRHWPDNWIIITNVDASASPNAGAHDKIREIVRKANPKLADRTHIWGGSKVRALLCENAAIAQHYGSFLTPGNILFEMNKFLSDSHTTVNDIIRYLVVSRFNDQQFTKLEQAGSSADNRPGIQKLFRDIPFASHDISSGGMCAATLVKAMSQNFSADLLADTPKWREWQKNPARARVWFIKGGPGRGKSTLTQYFCQIQRAAILARDPTILIPPGMREAIGEIRSIAQGDGLWPSLPRIPVAFELKEYAKWIARQNEGSIGVLSYLASLIEQTGSQDVMAGTLKRAFSKSRWSFIFDGMDEVPGDVKDRLAKEITYFVDDVLIGCSCDAHIICTSRPQGYSGQFDTLNAANIKLTNLNPDQALECARPILVIDRPPAESQKLCEILSDALTSQSIREIMTTPLQSHIMAVVVRDGGRPPERRWELFSNFYKVINKREMDKSADKKLSHLLRGNGKLIKALHNKLGFELHSRAEQSQGAQTSLERSDLMTIIDNVVKKFQSDNYDDTISTLYEATTDRLVLVNTPENSESVRFDIRPLQEFFAAEYIYESADFITLPERIRAIASDSHWREVLHFLLSALIENNRKAELAQVIQVLSEVDDPSAEAARPFARRLSIGAHAVARLLQEGVLEEDQRMRHSFKGCLLPIFSTTDAWKYLCEIDREHSKSWAIDLVGEAIRDQVEPENVGAGTIALRMIDDTAKQSAEIEGALLATSMEYRSCILAGLQMSHRRPTKNGLPAWGSRVALRTLLQENWHNLTEDALTAAFAALDDDKTIDIALHLGFSPAAAGSIRSLLGGYNDPRRESKAESQTNEHGMVSTSIYSLPSYLSSRHLSSSVIHELRNAGGLISAATEVVCLSSGEQTSPRKLLAILGGQVSRLELLPPQILSYFEDDFTTSLEMDPACDLMTLLRRDRPGQLRSRSFFVPDSKTKDWSRFIVEHLGVAIHFLAFEEGSGLGRPLSSFIETSEGGAALLQALRQNPRETLASAGLWGKFIKLNPSYEAEFRQIFTDSTYNATRRVSHYTREMFDFPIHLPEESGLLPYILQPLVRIGLNGESDTYRTFRPTLHSSVSAQISSKILACNVTKPQLMSISEGENHPPRCEQQHMC